MGSITKITRTDRDSGKDVDVFRAYVRREGYKSKSRVCATRKEAKDWLRENEATTALEPIGRAKPRAFSSVAVTFVESPPTKGTKYRSAQHIDFWREQFGDRPIDEIGRADINDAVRVLRTRPAMRSTPKGAQPTDDKLTPATVNRYLASLSSVFNYSLDLGLIEAHPMKAGKVKKLTEGGGRTRVLTADEEGRLMAAARASTWPMLALFIRMCLTTAARKSEVLKLRWEQVHLADSIAVLGKTKNGRPRALPLVDDVVKALRDAAKVKPVRGDYVFFNPRDPERVFNPKNVWDRCRQAAGLLNDRADPLDRVVLHSTRHTAVTRMLKGGANLAQAAAVSGHQTLAMLKRYEHLAAADSVALAQRLLAGTASKGQA